MDSKPSANIGHPLAEIDGLLRRSDVLAILKCGKTKLSNIIDDELLPDGMTFPGGGSRTKYWTRSDVIRLISKMVESERSQLAEAAAFGLNAWPPRLPAQQKKNGESR